MYDVFLLLTILECEHFFTIKEKQSKCMGAGNVCWSLFYTYLFSNHHSGNTITTLLFSITGHVLGCSTARRPSLYRSTQAGSDLNRLSVSLWLHVALVYLVASRLEQPVGESVHVNCVHLAKTFNNETQKVLLL